MRKPSSWSVFLDHKQNASEKQKTLPAKSPDLAHSLILGVDLHLRLRPVVPKPVVPTQQEQTKAILDKRNTMIPKLMEKILKDRAKMANAQGKLPTGVAMLTGRVTRK